MNCGRWSSRCFRLNHPSRRAVGPVFQIVPLSQAFCSSCAPALLLFVLRSGTPSVRLALRHSLGVAATGDGLWVRYDLLAALAGLAEGRSLGSPPARAPRPPGAALRARRA